MDFLAICKKCDDSFLFLSITRPPQESVGCKYCDGIALIARGNEAADIADLLELVYRGASPAKARKGALKLASKIENGEVDANQFLDYLSRPTRRQTVSVGHRLSGGVVICGATMFVLSMARSGGLNNLQEQVNELALRVLTQFDESFAWMPGPSAPSPVLGPKEKPLNRKGSRGKTQTTGRSEISGAPKRKRSAAAEVKRNKKP